MVRQNQIKFFKVNIHIDFGQCGEQHGVWAVFKCRKEVKAMNACLTKWLFEMNKKKRIFYF